MRQDGWLYARGAGEARFSVPGRASDATSVTSIAREGGADRGTGDV